MFDQTLAQAVVDAPPPAAAQAGAKRMEHAHVRQVPLVGQPGESAPLALLRQQGQQEVEGMDRCQQRQEMHAPKLGGAKFWLWAPGEAPLPVLVDEVVWNVGIKPVEKFGGAGGR